MCGITGILAASTETAVEKTLVHSMAACIEHRGPDALGVWAEGPAGLGHARLSVIDLAGGAQPMLSKDGQVAIVFNGEIYNFPVLKRELEAEGVSFRTRSDTEVILECYLRDGIECVQKIEGMFSFAIWDGRAGEGRLLIARDRIGIKPLYMASGPDGLVFSSEIKSLLLAGVVPDVDPVAFHQILLFGNVPAPRTILKGVEKLPPGHLIHVAPGEKPVARAFWKPRFAPEIKGTDQDLQHGLRERMTVAVRRQLISDVPVGAFLSGGLDSSIIVGLMAEEFPERVNAFSVAGKGFVGSELEYAREVAQRLGVNHHTLEIDRGDFLDVLPDAVYHNDDPTPDPAIVPLYHLSRLARKKVTVVLSGEGSDELFAGYGHYPDDRQKFHQFRRLGALPTPVRRMAVGLLSLARGGERGRELGRLIGNVEGDPYGVVLRRPAEFDRRMSALIGDGEVLEQAKTAYREVLGREAATTGDPLEYLLRADMRINLADFLLMRADNMAMAHGLELRVPFLDEEVVDYATRLPMDAKLRGAEGKAVLRSAFADFVPPSVRDRAKAPFPVPLAEWVLGNADLLQHTVVDGALVESGLLDGSAVRRFVEEVAGHPDETELWDCLLAWRLLYLEIWARRFLRGERVDLAG